MAISLIKQLFLYKTVKPLNVSISNKKAIVNTKKRYTSECRSVGSSPPANLTWYIGARELQTNETKVSRWKIIWDGF